MTTTPTVPTPSFTVSRKALLPVLKQVTRACAKGSAALLNTCVLLDARPGKDGKPASLTMAATDLINSVRGKMGLMSCTAEGVYALPGARLAEVVNAMRGGDEIKFEPLQKRDTLTVLVSTGKSSRVELPYVDPTGFPHIYTAAEDKAERHKIPSADLERVFKNVRHAATSEVTSNFHGVYLSASPQSATGFSEPSSAVSLLNVLPEGLLSAAGVLLPLNTVETILGLCAAGPEVEIAIKARDNGTPLRVYLRDKTTEIAVMLPGNTFPPALPGQVYGAAQQPSVHWHKMRRDEVLDAARLLLTVLAGSKSDPRAAVRFDKGIVRMQTSGDAGTCDQEIVSNTPEDFEFTAGVETPQRDCGMSINHLISHLSTPAMQAAEEFEIGISDNPMGMQLLRPAGENAQSYVGAMNALSL